jgi:hypothetical protein
MSMRSGVIVTLVAAGVAYAQGAPAAGQAAEHKRRVEAVTRVRGFVALWDFVRKDGERFDAYKGKGESGDFRLDALNYVRDYWGAGRAASYGDFPLLGRGPFGQAIRLRKEEDPNFRPCLLIPRERVHGTGLDVKGPGRPVSMVVWLIRESGNHAIAGIWHEGTDLKREDAPVRVERGKRQYALFAGAAAAHVSENGARSFGDRYARNLAVTPRVIPAVPADSPAEVLDRSWSVVGFTFDNAKDRVTAYLDGVAEDHWIENPDKHPFYQWPARGWRQAKLARMPGLQEGEDPSFPRDQFYEPPENKPLSRTRTADGRWEIRQFEFTRVRVDLRTGDQELIALRANPYWFGHDLYAPANVEDGGPFTIGRVIHTGRNVGFTGYIGAVAVFSRALSAKEMKRLAEIARTPISVRE